MVESKKLKPALASGQSESAAAVETQGCQGVAGGERSSPRARHRRATQVAERCWIDGRWSDALLHFLEAEAHLHDVRQRRFLARPNLRRS